VFDQDKKNESPGVASPYSEGDEKSKMNMGDK